MRAGRQNDVPSPCPAADQYYTLGWEFDFQGQPPGVVTVEEVDASGNVIAGVPGNFPGTFAGDVCLSTARNVWIRATARHQNFPSITGTLLSRRSFCVGYPTSDC